MIRSGAPDLVDFWIHAKYSREDPTGVLAELVEKIDLKDQVIEFIHIIVFEVKVLGFQPTIHDLMDIINLMPASARQKAISVYHEVWDERGFSFLDEFCIPELELGEGVPDEEGVLTQMTEIFNEFYLRKDRIAEEFMSLIDDDPIVVA